jgi:hypothetical protein
MSLGEEARGRRPLPSPPNPMHKKGGPLSRPFLSAIGRKIPLLGLILQQQVYALDIYPPRVWPQVW